MITLSTAFSGGEMRVFQNACIVTVNSDFDVIRNGTLAVEGKKIAYVGPHKEFPGTETVDCSGKVIMPGFVNGHAHMPMIFFRGYTDDLNLQDWLWKKIFPLETRQTAVTEYHGALAAAAELTRTGTTTVNDMYYHGEHVARALKEAGLSGIVSSCLMSTNEKAGEVLQSAIELADLYRNDEDIRTAIAPHAEYTCTPEDLRYWGEVAIKTGQPIHIHCSETRSEHDECIGRHGKTPVELFESLGMMDAHMLLAHCVYITENDMDKIKKHGASVLHNPISNLKLASGVAPIPRMLEKGLKVAISTDGPASNNTQDMWEEMRVAALVHKGYLRDPLVMDAKTSLYYATKGAALALGYEDRGSLEEGMRADFVVFRTDSPAMNIPTDMINLIVYSGNSRDIVMTVAGGEVLYDNGEYKKLDIEKVMGDARADFENIFRDR